tara:strand:- start:5150 stop:5884 length:735 start_codon:yes stop_codon:yes gene_type:complete
MKLLLEKWQKFLDEDSESRARFAKGVKDLPVDVKNTVLSGDEKYEKKAIARGRSLKQIFAKEADRSFIDSLTTVHWGEFRGVIDIIKDYKSLRRDELSAIAYRDASEIPDTGPWGFNYGVVIKGYITILANDMDDLGTGSGRHYREEFPERTKQSGANKGITKMHYFGDYEKFPIIVLDEEDYDPAKDWKGNNKNEALVDNWKIVAVIIPAAADAGREILQFRKYLQKAGIDADVVTPKQARQL